ncbi:GNAT family N-acetyltransferase [Microbacterium sp. SD291]|uniref:GNAT family N-acetyltransferase n=1 Tax=Microbacterium sp. SD291 TaxID=2782007 RepID=UPI001A9581C9|nr:GNAT family protein [Microbacterium sp. SD291]MBO0979509.1 GNAT family N-acetyltransferase [Microbacterium sp. SD291]
MDQIALRRWADDDAWLLERANTVEMTANQNGPENEEELTERHARYLRLQDEGSARMFVIVDDAESVGSIGAWRVDRRGRPALETGWFVLPEFQGRGIATRALALLVDDVREHRDGRGMLTAFPSVLNAPSNGVCRRNGFILAGTMTQSFRGGDLTCNEWVLDLGAVGDDVAGE